MNMITIEEAEHRLNLDEFAVSVRTLSLKKLTEELERDAKDLELLKTQIASARIDGKKEFDADTYMKGKKK